MKVNLKFGIIVIFIICFTMLSVSCNKEEEKTQEVDKTSQNEIKSNVKWSGVWEYRYNTKDIAQVRISNETDDGFDFGLFIAEYREDGFIWQGGFSCYINKQDNTSAKFSIDRMNFGVQTDGSLEKVEGVISINPKNDELTIRYDKIELLSKTYNTQLPTNYKRVEQDKIESAIYSMPFNHREPHMRNTFKITSIETANSVFGAPKEVKEWTGYKQGDTERGLIINYPDTQLFLFFPKGFKEIGGISWCVTSRQDLIFLRGIKIGDSTESILKKFPDEGNEIIKDYRGAAKLLYGKFTDSGTIIYLEDYIEVRYIDGAIYYAFFFDKNNKLFKVQTGPTA